MDFSRFRNPRVREDLNRLVDITLDTPRAYYYGVQSSILKSGTHTIDDCTAVTAYLLQTTGAFTLTGRFAPLQALISGDGTVGVITKTGNGAVHAAWIANRGTQTNTDSILCVHNQSAATAVSAIEVENLGSMTNIFEIDLGATTNFLKLLTVEGCLSTETNNTYTTSHKLKVDIADGTTAYIPLVASFA